jgi:hypothetical protein
VPTMLVADIHGGEVVLLLATHPDDTLAGMQEEARRIRAVRRFNANRLHAKPR